MINLFGFDVSFPSEWKVFLNPIAVFVINILIAIILAVLLQKFIFRIVKLWTQKTKSDLDDIILGIVRYPLILLLILLGIKDAFDSLHIPAITTNADKTFWALTVALVTYLVWRVVFKELLMYYGRKWAEESESSIDDILLPIVNIVAPIIIILVGGLVFLQVLGFDISALTVIIGGASFILAFALQSTLTNIFSGISLIIDTPFKYGDVIVLADGRVCEVNRIGLRITELYNTGDHSIIFMPNSKMADEMLVNITRPTPDLKASVVVGVETRKENLHRVPELLLEIARSNPYLLGDGKQNLDAMKRRREYLQKRIHAGDDFASHFSDELKEVEWGLAMLEVQNKLHGMMNTIAADFADLASFIHEAEETDVAGLKKTDRKNKKDNGRGLSPEEKQQILEKFNAIYDTCKNVLLPTFESWVNVRLNDPKLLIIDKNEKIPADAIRRKKAFIRRLEKLKHIFTDPSEADEWRLDTLVEEFSQWMFAEFVRPAEEWELPDVGLDLGDYTFNYKLTFFVDDIQAERFGRLDRVLSDLKTRIAERLAEEEINMPNPVRSVEFMGALNLVQSKPSGG
jgi:MscS family membrane protein